MSSLSRAISTTTSSGLSTCSAESQQDAPEKESGGNSAQARKDQKRREAEFRTQTQPLRKQIAKLEQQMEKLGAELAAVEEQLADSALYDISRKAELTDCL